MSSLCCFRSVLVTLGILSCATWAEIHYTSQSSPQQAVDRAKPGDAVVFDGGSGGVAVSRDLKDIQFIGGGAHWIFTGGTMEDCAFLFHNAKVDQKGGKIRRTVFWKSLSSSGTFFTHLDSVSFYYAQGYLWPRNNPDNGKTPQFQVNGFMRGVLIHKPTVGLLGYSKQGGERVHTWDQEPAMRLHATHPEGNGWGTYIFSPIIWEQTNWMPFHIVRAKGLTFAHANSEYGEWAEPVVQMDNCTQCMVLSNGLGGRGSATNNYGSPNKVIYPNGRVELGQNNSQTPYKGAGFMMAGQMNKSLAMGNYKTWDIGLKDWIPGLHYTSGVAARDPFFQDWAGKSGPLSINFAESKGLFQQGRDGSIITAGGKLPLSGADVVKPVVMRVPDMRAIPTSDKIKDMSGKSASDIIAAVKEGDIYLGPGNYDFGSSTLDAGGVVWGAGIGKTVLKFSSAALGNRNRGFINLTVDGGTYGLVSGGGVLGKTLLRVRFQNIGEAAILNGDGGCWQNDAIHEVEVHDSKHGFTMTGGRCQEPFKFDKVDIANCDFKNLSGDAIHLTDGGDQNGQAAILDCTFENIGGAAIRINRGQTHLVQNLTIKNVGTKDNQYPAVFINSTGSAAATHVTIDNSGVTGSTTGIRVRGEGGVSHAKVQGIAVAVSVSETAVVDHVTADGNLSAEGSIYVAKSSFKNVSVGISDSKVAVDKNFRTVEATDPRLDDTPPPEVNAASVKVEKKTADDLFPYINEYNLISWNGVQDVESGITAYVVYSGNKEVGVTPANRIYGDWLGQGGTPVALKYFRDPNVENRDYRVVPVNGAQMLPDGSFFERRWLHGEGYFEIEGGKEFRLDEIEVQDRENRIVTDLTRNISFNAAGPENKLTNDLHPVAIRNHFGPPSLAYGNGPSSSIRKPVRASVEGHGPRFEGMTFFLPRAAQVRLTLLDTRGRARHTLFRGMAEAGSSAFSVEDKALERGFYLLRLEALDRVITQPYFLLAP